MSKRLGQFATLLALLALVPALAAAEAKPTSATAVEGLQVPWSLTGHALTFLPYRGLLSLNDPDTNTVTFTLKNRTFPRISHETIQP